MKWIDVKYQLPDTKPVLVQYLNNFMGIISSDITTACFDNNNKGWLQSISSRQIVVISWQPLPEINDEKWIHVEDELPDDEYQFPPFIVKNKERITLGANGKKTEEWIEWITSWSKRNIMPVTHWQPTPGKKKIKINSLQQGKFIEYIKNYSLNKNKMYRNLSTEELKFKNNISKFFFGEKIINPKDLKL